MNFNAQGTTEYLLIIGVVITISLIIVGLMTGVVGNSQSNESNNKLAFLSQEIAITDSIQTSKGYLSLNLKSNTSESITITNISIDKNESSFNTPLPTLATKKFILQAKDCISGQNTQQSIVLTYTTLTGLTKKITYPAKLITECTNNNITQTMPNSNYSLSLAGLKNGLLRYWPLDNNFGEYSGNNVPGTNNGGTQTTGKISGAYYFNGTNYASSNSDISWNNSNSVSISFWIKTSNINTSNGGILGKQYSNWEWAFYQNRSTVNLVYWNTSGVHTNGMDSSWGSVLTENTWTYLTYTWDGSTSRFYSNGSLVQTKIATNPSINQNRSNNFMFGGNIYVWGDKYFDGSIDEVAIWDRTLNEDEISLLYNFGEGRSLLE